MGEEAPVNMNQLLEASRSVNDRLARLEAWPQPDRGGKGGNPNRQRHQPEDEIVEDSEYYQDDPLPAPNIGVRRSERARDRNLDDERPRHESKNLKLTAPTFAGRVNPEAYLDWEKRMENIFEYYGYSDARKVSLAAAQFMENALAWWDREVSERMRHRHGHISTWEDMRYQLRKRYVPSYYHRDLQKKFRKLTQGSKSVEDYFEEFEMLKNRIEVEDSEETIMAELLDGLHDRIARKVERQVYQDLEELLHLAVQAEQHIKRKTAQTTRNRPAWTPQSQRNLDKVKSIELESKFKKPVPYSSKPNRPEPGKFPTQATRTPDITCFKCQGKGHYARECPNQRVMVLRDNGEYEFEDEVTA